MRQEKIKDIKPYLKDKYQVYTGVVDLYVYFFEKGINILKTEGNLGFISSNKFINANYGKRLRKLIYDSTEFKIYVDHSNDTVFPDATTYPGVFILKKGQNVKNVILINNEFELNQTRLTGNVWNFEKPEILDLRDKINNNGVVLKDIIGLDINRGLTTGFNKAFVIDENTKNQLVSDDQKNQEIIKPLIQGKGVKKWRIEYQNLYLIWTYIGVPIENYPSIKSFLEHYKNKLEKRWDQGNFWWELRPCDYYDEFDKEKIIWAELSSKPSFVVDTNGLFLLDTTYLMVLDNDDYDLYYFLCLLNSKLIFWLFKHISNAMRGGYYRYKKQYVEQLPIYPANSAEQKTFIEKAHKILQLNRELQNELNGFKHWIQKEFNVEKLSKKLDKYYELSEDEFIDEMRKKKVDTKSRKNREYLEWEFRESLNIINPLLQKIKETDDEIDHMVYELYGLTEGEIQIIEDTLKN